jgi:hypothetical protein
MEPVPLAESVEPATVVVVGTVGVPVGGRYPFVVERWFNGAAPAPVLTLQGAEMPGGAIDTCGRMYVPGQRLILVGDQEGNELLTSICRLGGKVDTEEGGVLVAEAERLFGAGILPADPELTEPPTAQEPPPAAMPSSDALPIVLVGGASVGLVVLVGAAVILLLRQRRPPV